jgi:release factor glutamine methyltransferase
MQTAIQHIRASLSGILADNEIISVSRLLLSKITGFDFTGLLVNKNTIISDKQRELLENYLQKLKNGMPVQYVLGETGFLGLTFKVDARVLIPRPETEELVEWILAEASENDNILDIGTGSGCIPVSLKYNLPNADISACDISEEALSCASENANLNNVHVNFFKLDILGEHDLNQTWDVIVSNPPYVPDAEKSEIKAHVLDFEPHLALFVSDNDPLIFYRKITLFAQKHLKAGGKLFFEIHRDYGEATVKLLKEMSFRNILLKKDIHGNNRMIRAENAK